MEMADTALAGISGMDRAPPGLMAPNERTGPPTSSFLLPDGSTKAPSRRAGLTSTPYFGVCSPWSSL
jgi:hypothetical protein